MSEATPREPALDLEAWRAGSDLDRQAWSMAVAEHLGRVLRSYISRARQHYYRPADENDWSVPDMERALARYDEAVAAYVRSGPGHTPAHEEAHADSILAAAAVLEAMPQAMKDDLGRGTLKG